MEFLSPEEIHNLSKEVNQNARNVYRLLENLLDWSSSQLGSNSFNPVEFDINKVVSENINLYRKTAKNKEIDLSAELSNDMIVYADKNMIDSILRNLINNAIKFTQREGRIKVTTRKSDDSVYLKVEDNGIGMSKEKLDKLFHLDADSKRDGTEMEKGTGLGLVLTKEFIDKNNGTLHIESKENKGTVFTISLPAKK